MLAATESTLYICSRMVQLLLRFLLLFYCGIAIQSNALQVTSTHPIWSADRNDWVHAGELRVGERVQTRTGITTLTAHSAKDTLVTVYNLEVFREHNFFVGHQQMLAHNGGICDWGKVKDKLMSHSFSADHLKGGIMDLGKSKEDIVENAVSII